MAFCIFLLFFVPGFQVSIFAGALFIQLALGWDMYLSIIVLLLVTAVFTVLGEYICRRVLFIPLMQTNLLRHRLMQHFTKVGGN